MSHPLALAASLAGHAALLAFTSLIKFKPLPGSTPEPEPIKVDIITEQEFENIFGKPINALGQNYERKNVENSFRDNSPSESLNINLGSWVGSAANNNNFYDNPSFYGSGSLNSGAHAIPDMKIQLGSAQTANILAGQMASMSNARTMQRINNAIKEGLANKARMDAEAAHKAQVAAMEANKPNVLAKIFHEVNEGLNRGASQSASEAEVNLQKAEFYLKERSIMDNAVIQRIGNNQHPDSIQAQGNINQATDMVQRAASLLVAVTLNNELYNHNCQLFKEINENLSKGIDQSFEEAHITLKKAKIYADARIPIDQHIINGMWDNTHPDVIQSKANIEQANQLIKQAENIIKDKFHDYLKQFGISPEEQSYSEERKNAQEKKEEYIEYCKWRLNLEIFDDILKNLIRGKMSESTGDFLQQSTNRIIKIFGPGIKILDILKDMNELPKKLDEWEAKYDSMMKELGNMSVDDIRIIRYHEMKEIKDNHIPTQEGLISEMNCAFGGDCHHKDEL